MSLVWGLNTKVFILSIEMWKVLSDEKVEIRNPFQQIGHGVSISEETLDSGKIQGS